MPEFVFKQKTLRKAKKLTIKKGGKHDSIFKVRLILVIKNYILIDVSKIKLI